jgi:hypothetical protein
LKSVGEVKRSKEREREREIKTGSEQTTSSMTTVTKTMRLFAQPERYLKSATPTRAKVTSRPQKSDSKPLQVFRLASVGRRGACVSDVLKRRLPVRVHAQYPNPECL